MTEDMTNTKNKVAKGFNNVSIVIHMMVGICFFLSALFALINSFWDFSILIQESHWHPPEMGQAIIQLISDLLLVLIILEVLGTVINFIKKGDTSLTPFLFIGIISAVRGILSIGAKLSIGGERIQAAEFNHAMIELGVNAAVILAIGITIKLVENHKEKSC